MSENELIGAYLDGRMDRRQFIKRLVALGVSVAAAGAYAQVFATRAAEAGIRRDEHGFFVTEAVSAAEYAAPRSSRRARSRTPPTVPRRSGQTSTTT